MGTRNLTMVIKDEKTRIAQYGQWDGYPSGQGKTIMELLSRYDELAFKFQLDKCRFVDDEKQKEIDAFYKSIGVNDGWLNMQQARDFKNKYPFFSRDNGANILNLVNDSEEDIIWLYDESGFVKDSLMNEWTYVLDYDKRTFEVYTGYNKTPLHKHERFYKDQPNDDGYYPVKNIAVYSLDDLPAMDEFLKLESVESEE